MNYTFYGGHVHRLTALPLICIGVHIYCGKALTFSFPPARSWLKSSHFILGLDHDNLNRLASSLILSPYQDRIHGGRELGRKKYTATLSFARFQLLFSAASVQNQLRL